MKDKLIDCPCCGEKAACYQIPINEFHSAYNCFGCGFTTNDLLIEGQYDVEQYEETLPELYKDAKKIDDRNIVWYPQAINLEGKGTVFLNGSNKDHFQWCAIKSIPLTEEEKSSAIFKNKSYKSDSKSLKYFGKDFIEACDYIGFFDL